eukprot:gene9789-6866_t
MLPVHATKQEKPNFLAKLNQSLNLLVKDASAFPRQKEVLEPSTEENRVRRVCPYPVSTPYRTSSLLLLLLLLGVFFLRFWEIVFICVCELEANILLPTARRWQYSDIYIYIYIYSHPIFWASCVFQHTSPYQKTRTTHVHDVMGELRLHHRGFRAGGCLLTVPFTCTALWIYLLCGVAAFLMAATTPLLAAGWSSKYIDFKYGPCGWDKFAPECLPCTATASTSTTQYSPISFQYQAQADALPARGLCFSRVFPYVGVNYTNGIPTLNKPSSTVIIAMNAGGVVEARCVDNAPMFVQVWNCDGEGTDPSIAKAAKNILDDLEDGDTQLMEVIKVQFYNGPNHGMLFADNEFFSPGRYYETEYHLAKVTDKFVYRGETYYESQCKNFENSRRTSDLIISLLFTPSAVQGSANSSTTVDLLGELTSVGKYVSNLSAYYNALELDHPLMPLLATSSVRSGIGFFYYEGSLSEPPCTPSTPRLVSQTILTSPPAVLNLLRTTSGQPWNAAGSLVRPLLKTTKLYAGQLYQLQNNYFDNVAAEERAKREAENNSEAHMDSRVLALVVLNIVLLGMVSMLVLSRYALLEFMPPGLGGLNVRFEWFRRSYVKAAELQRREEMDQIRADLLAKESAEEEEAKAAERARRQRRSSERPSDLSSSPITESMALSSHHLLIGSQEPVAQDEVQPFLSPINLVKPRSQGEKNGADGGGGLVTFQDTGDFYDHSDEAYKAGASATPQDRHHADPTAEYQSQLQWCGHVFIRWAGDGIRILRRRLLDCIMKDKYYRLRLKRGLDEESYRPEEEDVCSNMKTIQKKGEARRTNRKKINNNFIPLQTNKQKNVCVRAGSRYPERRGEERTSEAATTAIARRKKEMGIPSLSLLLYAVCHSHLTTNKLYIYIYIYI